MDIPPFVYHSKQFNIFVPRHVQTLIEREFKEVVDIIVSFIVRMFHQVTGLKACKEFVFQPDASGQPLPI